MTQKRIVNHPIIEVPRRDIVSFSWNVQRFQGVIGEMISSARFANSIYIFGHHPKDNSPQGLFCANGQCSQCLVIANGLPVKACMTPLENDMIVGSIEGLPKPLPEPLPIKIRKQTA